MFNDRSRTCTKMSRCVLGEHRGLTREETQKQRPKGRKRVVRIDIADTRLRGSLLIGGIELHPSERSAILKHRGKRRPDGMKQSTLFSLLLHISREPRRQIHRASVRGSRDVGGSFCVRPHLRFLSMSCAISRWCCKAGKVLPAQSFNLESSPPLA